MLNWLRWHRRWYAWRSRDADVEEEMRFHIEQYRRDLVRSGVSEADASLRAQRDFGNVAAIKEMCREEEGLRMFDELARNVTYALRQLRRSPGFALAIILTLGLCIGVNTAVFSIVDAVLLRPLPYPEPSRLVEFVRDMRSAGRLFSMIGQDGYAWEALKGAQSFRLTAIGGNSGVSLGIDGHSEYVHQQRVSVRYFQVMGVPLALGRDFNGSEDRPGGTNVVILSYALWKHLFGGNAAIVGRTVLLRGEPYVVTGVAGEGFKARSRVDLWTPLRPSTNGEGAGINYELVARLNPGVTWARAQTEARTLGAAAFTRRKIPSTVTASMRIEPFDQSNQTGLHERLIMLSGAAGLVLLIGCVNIASLMLARGAARRREMGTRIALGGRPGSLVRQLTTESLVLGTIGGITGMLLAYASLGGLQVLVGRLGVWQEIQLDLRVLAVTAVLSTTVSMLFGLAPALQAARVDVREALVGNGAYAVAGGRSHFAQRGLVLVEIALCQVLLVGAVLLTRTLLHLQNLDPGFDATNVLTASASLQDARYRESISINRLFRDSLEAVRRVRGVQAAAVGLHVPYQRWLNSGIKIRGGSDSLEMQTGTSMNYVTPDYFTALRIAVRIGRVFNERDREDAKPVAVVNETFVRKFVTPGNVLNTFIVEREGMRQIVGVVADLQQQPGLSRSGPIAQEPAMYVPAAQFSSEGFQMAHTWFSPNWVVRFSGPRSEIERGIENAINRVDPLLPVASVHTMLDERDSALRSQQLNAWAMGSIAGLALLLALVGIYGLVANSVVERNREFGIRIALGCSSMGIIRSAIEPSVLLSAAGVIVGGLLAAGSLRMLSGLLYGIRPLDLPTFVGVGCASVVIAVVASLIAASGVVRLSPVVILRQE